MIEESEPGHSVDRKNHAPTDAHVMYINLIRRNYEFY